MITNLCTFIKHSHITFILFHLSTCAVFWLANDMGPPLCVHGDVTAIANTQSASNTRFLCRTYSFQFGPFAYSRLRAPQIFTFLINPSRRQ